MTDTQLAKPNQPTSTMATIRNYLLSPEVKSRFEDMLGRGASYYLNQVMIVVANSERLQQCTVQSIFLSAMRAATLRLSVDPGQGQAWIIPYAKVATFQLGYKGIYELAMRTNLYRFINVIDIFEGEELIENRMTGNHTIAGKPISNKKIAYMLYFQLFSGFEKTFPMTIQEIEQHAMTYAPKAYKDPDSPWNSHGGREREKMMKKTVLTNGLKKWGRFNQGDLETLSEIEEDQGWNEPGPIDPEPSPSAPKLEDPGTQQPKTDPTPTTTAETKSSETKPDAPKPLRYEPEILKDKIAEAAKGLTGQVSNGKKGLVATCLEAVYSISPDPEACRKQAMHWLTGYDSLKTMPDNFILALYKWLNPSQDSGGAWIADPMSQREALAVLNAAQPPQAALF